MQVTAPSPTLPKLTISPMSMLNPWENTIEHNKNIQHNHKASDIQQIMITPTLLRLPFIPTNGNTGLNSVHPTILPHPNITIVPSESPTSPTSYPHPSVFAGLTQLQQQIEVM